ncbi:MAG: hypothetical protein DHS80DRAFT_16880 [Piptocephalis tieghemiana]|nr:MAG: hypothetical protein DHS80DRAFT_16880 [Piptocephalis tieghemiana]
MSKRSPITSHVLDTALGVPASNLPLSLTRLNEKAEFELLASGLTDADGRCSTLLDPSTYSPLTPGIYRVRFDTRTYLEQTKQPVFYPVIEIVFRIQNGDEHYHIPLLLSPYGYSTYRGS